MDGPDKLSRWAVREVDHLFARFRRYTRFVFYSKWFLGGFALILMVSLIAYPLISKDRSGIRVSFVGTDNAGKPISSPVMENPEFKGTDAKDQQFKITGTRAIQKSEDLVVIEQVEGQLIQQHGGWVSVTADMAEYMQQARKIELIGNVTIADDSGYIFVTPRATVDTATMDVEGKAQVEGSGPQGNLLATGFKIRNNGGEITFGGRDRVNVTIEQMKQGT